MPFMLTKQAADRHWSGSSAALGRTTGTPGTLKKAPMMHIFLYARQLFGPQRFVFFDVGADSGEILIKAMAMGGATYAIGIERDPLPEIRWNGFFCNTRVLEICTAESIQILRRSTHCIFGTDVKSLLRFPDPPSDSSNLPQFFYLLCDGFDPNDMQHALELIGSSTKAVLLVCCCPQRGGHMYRKPVDVLRTLATASSNAGIPEDQHFQHTGRVPKTTMSGSTCTLNVHAFARLMPGFPWKVILTEQVIGLQGSFLSMHSLSAIHH